MAHLYRDDLVKKIGSLYKLVNLASMRAVELIQGAQKLVDSTPTEKVTNIVMREILEGKVTLKEKEEK